MIAIPIDLIDLEQIPVDFWEIEMKIREFYTILSYDEYELDASEIRMKVINASSVLNSARTLVKNLLMPEENSYIKENIKSYYLMIENLSRADKRMDESQKSLIDQMENARIVQTDVTHSSKVTSYERILKEFMDHLVYYPIKNAWKKFKYFKAEREQEINGEKVKVKILKDEKLFLYFVFLELYHSSESLGGIAREQTKFGKISGKASQTPLIEETIPPGIPGNIQIENQDAINIPEEMKEEEYEFA